MGKSATLGKLLCVFATCLSAPAQQVIIDQSYDPGYNNNFDFFMTHSAEGTQYGFGQEFTPKLASLNFVDLYLRAEVDSSQLTLPVHIEIRRETIDGPLLGTSSTVSFGPSERFQGEVRLSFLTEVPLEPSQRYVIKPIELTSRGSGYLIAFGVPRLGAGEAYDGGRWIDTEIGVDTTGRDMWFREGLSVVPEPSVAALLSEVAFGLFVSARLIRWRGAARGK